MTRGIRAVPYTPKADEVADGVILALWRLGYDTYEFARQVNLREAEIYNRLLHVREAGR